MASNNYIEKTANEIINGTLRDLFLSKSLELGEHQTQISQEKGIDYFIEVFNADKRQELLFLIQNKGKNKEFKIAKDKKSFSFTMKIRHAHYFYYELAEPLMFMVCDIQKKEIFWYSVQLDTQLENKIIEQIKSNKKSLQINIPIENILNQDNFERFLKDLQESQKVQIHKFKSKINLKANYKSLETRFSESNIIDKIINLLNLFEGVNVLPAYIIAKLYPFKGSSKTHLYGDTLSTDNELFFDLMSNIDIKDDKYYLKDNNVDYMNIPDFQNKINRIINFLGVNFITHISWSGKPRKDRICVHDLFTSKECSCERCSYRKLNLIRTESLLNVENKSLILEDKLRKAYTYYLMADFENAYLIYMSILKDISITKNPSLYTITKYNLLQIKNIVNNNYFGNARTDILKGLEKENFILDEMLIPDYFLDVFKLIKENNFINDAIWDIDNKLTDIKKIEFSDKFGGSATNSHARNLIVEFLRAYNFIEYNLIIFNEYREFEVLVNKSLEGVFALYALNNPSSSKYEHFGYTIINVWLFHAEPNHIRHLLKKYSLKSLKLEFEEIVFNNLLTYISNLIDSKDIIIKNFEAENFFHNDKIHKIINNYVSIITFIDLNPEKKNVLLNKFLILIESLDRWYFTSFEYLNEFLNHNENTSFDNLKKIIDLIVLHEHYSHDTFSSAINLYIKNIEDDKIEEVIKEVLRLDNINVESFYPRNNLSDLIFIIPKLKKSTREEIKKSVVSSLHQKFNEEVYYIFSIYNIIDYNKDFFEHYFKLTPDYVNKKTGHEFVSGKKELKNYHLDKVINLVYKYDLEFTPEIKTLSERAVDKQYYDWLMDIDDYDYSKFNPYWILNYQTKYYLKAFKKSKKLKSEIVLSLKEKYIEGIAKMYFKNLI